MKTIILKLTLLVILGPMVHGQRDIFGDIFSSVGSMVDSAMSSVGSIFGGGFGSGNRRIGGRPTSIFGDIDRSIPVIGSCDRIVYAGVGNCLANFGPTSVGSKGACCAYRKYRACINGLRDGHSFAVARKRCPQSFTTSAIHRISDSVVGVPLGSCKDDRYACGRKSSNRG